MTDSNKILAVLIVGFLAFGYMLRYDYVGVGDKPAFFRIDRINGAVTICSMQGCR